MSKIIDYKFQVQQVYEDLVRLNKELDFAWSYENDVQQKIQQETPTLMFYGVYNAGKSTLLNAIMGKEVASVADVPETHQVTPYSWNGYELYDTPGINGPEKDYVISKAEIIKHDIILFLVDDSDSFDNKLVTEEIIQVIQSGKPLILIMNNKQTIDGENDEDGVIKRGKLYKNIETLAQTLGISNITNKFSFMMIDADTALYARLNNKQLLLQDSRLEELEYLILQKLKEQDGFKFLIPPLKIIEQHLESIQLSLNKKLATEDEAKLNELISDLRDRRMVLLNSIKSKINTKLELTKNVIYNKLLNSQPVENDIQQMITDIEQLLHYEINQSMEHVSADVQNFLVSINVSHQLNNLNLASMDMKISDATIQETDDLNSKDVAANIATQLLQNQVVVKGAEKLLAKTILPKIAASTVPIGSILVVAKTIVDIITVLNKEKREREKLEAQVAAANAQQEEMIYRRNQAIQQLKSQLDAEFFRISEEIMREVDKSVKQSFSQYIEQIESELSLKQEESGNIHQYLSKVNDLFERTSLIKVQVLN